MPRAYNATALTQIARRLRPMWKLKDKATFGETARNDTPAFQD
jgi:hypothetical protein